MTYSEGTYEDESVSIRDDRTGAFTVTLSRLEKRDAGWYWCAAGQQRVAIHVVVTTRPTTSMSAKDCKYRISKAPPRKNLKLQVC